MGFLIKNKLVVAVSSRALFNLEEANTVFEKKGESAYRKYQAKNRDVLLEKGVAFPFITRLLRINERDPSNSPVEVIVLSKNDPESGSRFFKSCKHYGLNITRGVFTAGKDPSCYMEAFNACLFLSANKDDVQRAVLRGFPAGLVLQTTSAKDEPQTNELRIAFDFDGILADDESEAVFATQGLDAFHGNEVSREHVPHNPGLLKPLLSKLGDFQRWEAIQKKKNHTYNPLLRIAVVTARNAPAHERMLTTLRSWKMTAVEAFFLGGVEKKLVLDILKPHIFFDDQMDHLERAFSTVPSVHVPFGIKNRSSEIVGSED